jgi:UDP-2,3-diacylglucosamine pyrophosphatase LpxH
MLINALGLTQQKFPWKITEWNDDASRLHDICVAHRVYVQHGDEYDEFNYHKSIGRDGASLGDAIVIELINKFPEEVKRRIYKKNPNAVLPPEFLQALEELDNVRPSTHTVIFLRMVIDKLTPKEYRKIVKEVFYECSKSIADSAIFKRVRGIHWQSTSKLRALNFASQFSPTCIVRIVTQFVESMRSSYESAAAKEAYIKNDMCDYVVYGHTHDLAVEGIDLDKNKLPKVYINSATWRPVHKEINPEHKPEGFPYFTQQTMTWVAFFKEGERKGRKYEIWSGKLGE